MRRNAEDPSSRDRVERLTGTVSRMQSEDGGTYTNKVPGSVKK